MCFKMPVLIQMDQVLLEGLSQITWSSLNLDSFIAKANAAVIDFRQLLKQVSLDNFTKAISYWQFTINVCVPS